MAIQTERLSSPMLVIPEPEHNSYENIHYANQHALGWVLSALGSASRVLSGTISAGQIQGLKVLFNLADGTREVISFANTNITVGDNRKIYYADYVTETILSVELPGFEDFVPDEDEFPIVHAVRYHDTEATTVDRLEWIAPRTDLYAHIPLGKIMALHPYAPAPDSYFFKFMDGTGTLGANFPGHEADPIANLTDGRFLMGGTDHGIGGSNTLLDHTHSCGVQSVNHTHSGTTGNPNVNHNHSADPPSTSSGGRSVDHTHTNLCGGNTTGTHSSSLLNFGNTTPVGTQVSTYGSSVDHTHATNIASFNSGTVSAWHTHTFTTGNNSANHDHVIGGGNAVTATSSLPKYFKVKFYLKVN